MVGRLRELVVELVLTRGSVPGLARELEAVRVNHFVGFEKKLVKPEGEVERVKEGREGEGLTPEPERGLEPALAPVPDADVEIEVG